MSWFRVTRGRLVYRERITREPFARWASSPDGVAAINDLARQMGLRMFGRVRARRRAWRALDAAVRTGATREAIHAEADHFTRAMSDLAYAAALPRAQVALRRVVLVPRSLIAARARDGVRRRIGPMLAGVDEAVCGFFCEQLLMEMDCAIERARPTPASPVFAREEWWCVGGDRQYLWVDPMWSGPGWSGHVLLYEFPQARLAARERKELERAIREIQQSVTTLSRPQREQVLRMAVH
jgi:hypothetical protein